MKEVDVAREIMVKTMCVQNLNIRPVFFTDLSIIIPCTITLIQHITIVIFKYVSGVAPLITSQRYLPLVAILIMSQKLWFEGDVIPKALVGILKVGNDK